MGFLSPYHDRCLIATKVIFFCDVRKYIGEKGDNGGI